MEKLSGLHMQWWQRMSPMSLCQLTTTKATFSDTDNQHLKQWNNTVYNATQFYWLTTKFVIAELLQIGHSQKCFDLFLKNKLTF